MDTAAWLLSLEQTQTSYLLLATLAGIVAAAAILYQIGLIGWVLRGLGPGGAARDRRTASCSGSVCSRGLRGRYSWRSSAVFLLGGVAGGPLPGLRVLCGLAPLFMGIIACLAYMFIDLERNEVERGHKAVHNPLKGQVLAMNLERYGKQVRIPLLIAATVALIGGFALLNQGLYETIGQHWYQIADERREPIYADFLAYALTKLLGIIDVLDLAKSHHILGAAFVRPAAWPASALLAGFKVFFTLVLLHQIFASLRQGKLLAETITDFWSPHEPIHERARNALPIYGTVAIGPLLGSLRLVPSLTKEQRDQLPLILETIGPSIIPALVRHLHDPHEHVRAIVAAALGHLHARGDGPRAGRARPATPARWCGRASSRRWAPWAVPARAPPASGAGLAGAAAWWGGRSGGLSGGKSDRRPLPPADPIELAVATLESALATTRPAVRTQAALALGRIGPAAAAVAPRLIGLLKEADETVRCQAAQALGEVGGDDGATVAALVELLQDASAPVKVSAARALGALRTAAAPAVPALVPLLQDREESVRTAAAEAIAQVGPLDQAATDALVRGAGQPGQRRARPDGRGPWDHRRGGRGGRPGPGRRR